MSVNGLSISSFRRKILMHYEKHGRVLPFRNISNPYRITVSEFMLQQTQVERVVPKYLDWIHLWPSWQTLARSSRQEVLTAWSGLGYNRRAIYLRETAKKVISEHRGQLPDSPDELLKLPGIGRYTSRAILIFAHNRPLAAIDTNIRRVLIYELKLPASITLSKIEQIALELLPKRRPRIWHYALMDYGALALPRQIKRIRPLSRQSRFEGSLRQIRGEIIRQLTQKLRVRLSTIAGALGRSEQDVLTAAEALARDGLVKIQGLYVSLRQ